MITYFGRTSPGAIHGNPSMVTVLNGSLVFTCPGQGPQQVVEISVYTQLTGVATNIRLAIYDAANNLVGQGAAQIAVAGGPSWQGHFGAANITPNPCWLNGGQSYKIAYTKSSNGSTDFFDLGASGVFQFIDAAYYGTTGFPNPIAPAGDSTAIFTVRCGTLTPPNFVSVAFSGKSPRTTLTGRGPRVSIKPKY
jgi:hypothetical protein